MDLYLSPNGNDTGSGSRDAPLATLEGARDRIRALRSTDTPAGDGVTVWLDDGTWERSASFTLGGEDSGVPGAPVIYRALRPGRARLVGGSRTGRFQPVADPAVLSRLAPRAQRRVLQTDLREQGIHEFGSLRRRGFGTPGTPAGLELFFDGRPMPLARWPDVGHVQISDIPRDDAAEDGWGGAVAKPEAGFIFHHDRPRRWKTTEDVWVHGYWCWDWANTYERVEQFDPDSGHIRTTFDAERHYGFKPGQPFYFLNVLEELDRPGEWYLDRTSGILYFWPPASPDRREAWVSLLESPLLELKDVSHVVFRDLVFECTRGHAISIEGGNESLLMGCTVRNAGNAGVVIRGGADHAVKGADISMTGDHGIRLSGGDRKTLAPCNHVVENCHIHHFSRWSRCYCPAILADGVGMRFAHNSIHDAPHTAILFSGNEFLVEHNEIHSVCMETGDAGAIYTGRDYTYRGNAVRHNFIHHLGGVGMGTMGVYNDDCVSGTEMSGNVFYRLTRAAMLGGGRDLVVSNNLFVDCDPAISFDARGISEHANWQTMVYTTMKERLEEVNYTEPPYRTRYPELLDITPHYETDRGVPPDNCVATRNVCIGGRWLCTDGKSDPYLQDSNNVILRNDPGFADPARLDFRVPASSSIHAHGFRPIAMHEIGPRLDDTRSRVPARALVHIRLEVLEALSLRPGTRRLVGTVRATVENPGQCVARGRIALWVQPDAPARPVGRKEARYALTPGGAATFDFEVATTRSCGATRVGVHLAGEDFVRCLLTLACEDQTEET